MVLADYGFVISGAVLLASPFLCAFDPLRIRALSEKARRRLLVSLALPIFLGVVCTATNWSVRGVQDWVIRLFGYLAFAFVMSVVWRVPRRKGWRGAALSAILVCMVLIALAFPITFLEDYSEHGNVRMNFAYRFSAEWYGGAWSRHNGAWLSLYRTHWWLPFMEQKVWTARFQDDQCDFMRITESWTSDRKELAVSCPGLEHDVVLRTD